MNELADDGFHEIQLSGKQLVFLFMAGDQRRRRDLSLRRAGRPRGEVGPDDRGRRHGRLRVAAAGGGHAVAARGRRWAAGRGASRARAGARRRAELREAAAGRSVRLGGEAQARSGEDRAGPAAGDACRPRPAGSPPAASTRQAAAPAATATAPAAPAPSAGRPGGWIVQLMALQDRSAVRHARAASDGEGLSGLRRRSDAGLAEDLSRAGRRLPGSREGRPGRAPPRKGRAVQDLRPVSIAAVGFRARPPFRHSARAELSEVRPFRVRMDRARAAPRRR